MLTLGRRIPAQVVVMLLVSCISAPGQEYAGREKLRAQSNEFRKEVIRVTEGVYVAVGYSASNVILIQGDGESIIVDTRLGVSDQTVYRWKKQFAGLGLSEIRELRSLWHENAKLRQLVADLTLDRHILRTGRAARV